MSNDKTGKSLEQENSERDVEICGRNYFRKLSLFDDTVIAGAEMIGTSYDVFGKYCNVGSCMNSLFDERKVNSSEDNFKKITILGKTLKVPYYVDCYSVGDLKYTNASGESIESYQSSISSKSRIKGNYLFFSASLKVDFDTDSLTAFENAFSRIQYTYDLYILKSSAEALKEFLKESVKTALDKADTEEDMNDLFNTWGSHFLSGVVMGGCAQYSSSTNKYTSNLTNSFDVVAAASFAGFIGLSVRTDNSFKEDIKKFRSASNIKTHAIGGDLSRFDPFGSATSSEQPSAEEIAAAKKAFEDWKASVPNSPELVNFADSNPLTGIWELCSDRTQKAKLKKHFETVWAPAESAKRRVHVDYIDKIIIGIGNYGSPPEGYIGLENGKGSETWLNYQDKINICLFMHKAKYDPAIDNKDCITELKFITVKDKSPGGDWVKIPQNIYNSSSNYLYLCYLPAKYSAEKAIKDIQVLCNQYSSSMILPYGYNDVLDERGERVNTDNAHVHYLIYSAGWNWKI
ncbi:MAC/perforin domain-containing protein [Photorhabdus heterorhabditis]|uniref:MAC/perforin domain-containing protein n=1 Tax=Photorhabdus heterorhabditis TaxID=880156 RepID=UPI001BD28729|nr:MAC/perforin domain-containing protein [Photorhabdus heterorhabditis]MBS9443101.1 hypothetical protein [Photorhabdus heterorhabditis]